MAKSIINTNSVDFRKSPMFFGPEGLSFQRYDQPKYENMFNMFKQQISYFWRPEEINLSKDKGDFEKLPEYQQRMFTETLSYQILLDSVQSRGIGHLLEDCTNPEIEAFAKWWEAMETLHSYSYTYIIKQVYSNPTEILDSIPHNEEIKKRTESVTKYYDDLIEKIPNETEYDRKKKLYLTLVSINILEGVRFYVSFACSYSFAQNQKMEGNAKIISLINRDENLHMGFTSLILKLMAEKEEEGFKQIVEDCHDTVLEMYKDAANEEMEWAKYLFRDGAVIGLNEDILIQYMKWLTNNRLKSINKPAVFDKVKNPINWIKNWTESKSIQDAPQETEIINYVSGAIKQDVDDQNFDEYEF